ncbi:MAG: dihydroorotase [Nitrospirae bacterium]|nr:MAG: dihydroorotase [Nitrospirota bacterium]
MSTTAAQSLLIRHGLVIDPGRINEQADLLIRDGKIAAVGKDLPATQRVDVLDATGLWVLPGFVDLHVHLREPGFEYQETIQTGTAAAAAGGFTSICCMPNTLPVNDSKSITEFILDRAKSEGLVRVYPIGAITKRSEGKELSEYAELKDAGCVAVSDDGKPVMHGMVMRRALEYARTFDLPVVDHCECLHLSEGGVAHEGLVATELGLHGMPSAAEDVMVARNLELAELTGSKLHLAHLSTAGSTRMVREAKTRGVSVTAEACPHHFMLTEEAVREFNTNAKMNPPLRARRDVEAIRAALKDGTIDAIATDHAPHAVYEKQREFEFAPFGIVGLETALGLSLSLVEEGILTVEEVIRLLTSGPAKAFGLPRGTLAVGSDADIAVVDPVAQWVVDPEQFKSKGRNTPFGGWKLKGRVVKTFVGGKMVYQV